MKSLLLATIAGGLLLTVSTVTTEAARIRCEPGTYMSKVQRICVPAGSEVKRGPMCLTFNGSVDPVLVPCTRS